MKVLGSAVVLLPLLLIEVTPTSAQACFEAFFGMERSRATPDPDGCRPVSTTAHGGA